MSYDRKVFRASQDAIGAPGDPAATNSTDDNTQVSLLKGLYQKLTDGVAVTGAQTDDAAFVVGTTKVDPVAGIYKSSRDSVDDGDAGALAMTAKRGLYVTPESPNGDSLVDDTNDLLKVATIPGQNGVAAGAGAVSATVQRMTLASDDPAVVALQVIDDWDESDRAKVNVIVGQAGITAGAGAVAANTPRVTHASDDPVTTAVQIMDDWDETDRAKVNIVVGQAGVAAGAGSVGVNTQRVTLASDDPAVAILGAAGDAASATTTIKAALRGIATALGVTALDLGTGTGGSRTLRWFQDTAQWIGGAGSVTSATQRVTLPSDDPAVTTLGGTADAAVTAGATGSLSAKLRSISRDLVANIVLAAGTNLIGRTVADASAATGGISTTARMPSAGASLNATLVKGAAGRIYQASGKNNAAYDVFLVLYDSAANPPVPGTTTIRKKVICPAGQAFVYDWPVGLGMGNGIGYAFTKLVADADTTVLVAADITAFNMDYV